MGTRLYVGGFGPVTMGTDEAGDRAGGAGGGRQKRARW
jgi:hypothetical protein